MCALAAVLAAAAAAVGADEIVVPGGLDAVAARLGNVSLRPDEFVASLNRILLLETDPGGNPQRVRRRVELTARLAEIAAWKRDFGPRVEVETATSGGRARLAAVAERLGYGAACNEAGCSLVTLAGDPAARRRQLARDFGWDLPGGVAAAGERSLLLALPEPRVPSPLPLAEWSAWVGHPVDAGDALAVLATDQAFGFVLEGARRLDAATRAELARLELFPFFCQQAPAQFYRYASTLRLRDGRLAVPGGDAYRPLWRRLVGVSPDEPRLFVPALLTRRDGRVAFLWQALIDAPPEVARHYLGDPDSPDDRRTVQRVLAQLDATAPESFAAPLGGDLGFGTLVRSLPLVPGGGALDLPGGPGLWWTALREEEVPADPDALGRIVERGLARELDEAALLLATLGAEVDVAGAARPALPRLIGAAGLFGDRRDLLTPENVVLLARAVDSWPAALVPLRELEPRHPETVRDHLLAVAALDRLPRTPDAELLLVNYQAGAGLVGLLAGTTGLAADRRETHFAAWARLHAGAADPYAAAAAQLRWLEALLADLPPAEADSPGRGPLERALLAALAPARDPQHLELDGVAFFARRGLEARERMARRLAAQGIPACDDLVALARALRELRAACAASDAPAVAELAAEARRRLGRFPALAPEEVTGDRTLQGRLFPIDRPRLAAALAELEDGVRPGSLPRRAGEVERLAALLARELRAVMLAPSYLVVMARSDSRAFDSPDLIRSHRLWDFAAPPEADSAWRGTRIERAVSDRLGAAVQGAVAGVGPVLAEYAEPGGGAAAAGAFRDVGRLRAAFGEWLFADWEAIDPRLSGAVAAAIDLADALRARAADRTAPGGDAARRRLARFIPGARLERDLAGEPIVSLSERLAIGLDLLDDDAEIESLGRPAAVAAFAAARAAHGPDLRRRLDETGTAAPRIHGNGRRSVGHWPSYEQVERERRIESLEERGRLDIKLAVVRELGRRRLDGVLGIDLLAAVLADMRTVSPEGPRDWESWIRWTNGLDGDFFDRALHASLARGEWDLE